MRVTIEKKTDQLNYEDFLGGVTRIVTIAGVKAGTKEQQYDIALEGDTRVWRPAVTVLKLLVEAWGDDATEWVGRRVQLYGDPTITFGRDVVGGIRVSHVSHIAGPVSANLTETRGKRKKHTLQPLPDVAPVAPQTDTAPLVAALTAAGIDQGEWLATAGSIVGRILASPADLTQDEVGQIVAELTRREIVAQTGGE